MKYSTALSGYLMRGKGMLSSVEVDISFGLHSFVIVGLGDKAVNEARDRIGAAIKNSGFVSPKQKNQKVIISLSPAHTKKEGTSFDVAMAIAYLNASEEATLDTVGKLFIGELGLDGHVRKVRGVLPMLEKAQDEGIVKEAFIPKGCAAEASLITSIKVYEIEYLSDIVEHLLEKKLLPQIHLRSTTTRPKNQTPLPDIREIQGLTEAKRALEIAATGSHSIGFYGPAGSGKTSLAQFLPHLCPPPTDGEILEINSLYSAAGLLEEIIRERPFRAPHHSSSPVAILGGAQNPGEISLAHRGVLFLDEFPHFDRRVIEGLREPLQEKILRIGRGSATTTYPADILLAVAMNPCPCGNYGSTEERCSCVSYEIRKYQQKISGPIIDRIHLWVHVPKVILGRRGSSKEDAAEQETTEGMIERIKKAHHFRKNNRFTFEERGHKVLAHAARIYHLSPRTYKKMLSIAKTIAALSTTSRITAEHMREALTYRPKIVPNT